MFVHKIICMKKESIQIKFEGQNHQIDSNTLINTLIHYNTIINISNDYIGDGIRKVNVKINAIEKGSFIIDIELVESLVKNIFSSENISYLSNLAGIVGGVYAIYQHKKGKPINNETHINIDNHNIIINDTTVNIYNNQVVRESISKSIETANEDSAVEGIKISNKKGEFAHFEKADFKNLIYTDFAEEEKPPQEQKVVIEDATLGIIKLSFERGKTWEFIYNGFRISMIVKDDALMNLIDSGTRFAKGDSIKVKLEILQRYNSEYNAYENKGYRILEFIDHIKSPTQTKIKFKD